MLSEADGAFYSFLCVMLLLYIVPAVLFVAFKLIRQPKKALFATSVAVNVLLLSMACYALYVFLGKLQQVDTSGVFDPYEILQISEDASLAQIKKAFRRLSRQYHPDKNRHNTKASQRLFTRVTKAYEALTDPIAMKNYALYGHPDGRQSMLMDFAFLSSVFGGSGDSNGGIVFVVVYFAVVLVVILLVVKTLTASNGQKINRNRVSRETAAKWQESFDAKQSVHDVLEMCLVNSEMCFVNAKDAQEIDDKKHSSKFHDKFLKRMEAAKAFPPEITKRIKKQEHFLARENLIALYFFLRHDKMVGVVPPIWLPERLHLVRTELPFMLNMYAQFAAQECVRRGYQAVPLQRALSVLSALAQGSFVADATALQEQSSRAEAMGLEQLPKIRLEDTRLFVVDEPNVQPGDYITVSLKLVRDHVVRGQKAPTASTLYEGMRDKALAEFAQETIWFTVVDKASNQLFAAWKCSDLAQEVNQSAVFLGPGSSGKYEFEIRAICVSYLEVHASAIVPLIVESSSGSN